MKHTKEMFLHWSQTYDGKDEWRLFHCDMTSCGYVLADKQMIEFESPDDFNPVPIQIDMLNAEKAKALDKYNERVFELNEKISKLQCLEFTA